MSRHEHEHEHEHEYDGPDRRSYDNTWHLDRKVPISIIGVIIFQTFGFGWWAATIESKIEHINKTMDSRTIDRYHKRDALAAHELLDTKITYNRDSILQIHNTLKEMNQKLDRLVESNSKHKH